MESEINDKIRKTMRPLLECPLCGLKPQTKESFKGRSLYRNKRKTQYCACGWSRIIPTEREALTELGLI
jgi:hypothetical protein